MREVIAALLRSRGWEHDDAADPADMFWHRTDQGVRPILVALSAEMNADQGGAGYYSEPYRVQNYYPAPARSIA